MLLKKLLRSKLLIFLFVLCGALNAVSGPGKMFLLEIQGTINPVVSEYITKGLKEAEKRGAGGVIIKMDTPGGLMDSMREIIKSMESFHIPVIVYVGGSGARAASAGTFITLASDIAVMAEGTNIGSAHPVKMEGQKIDQEMEEKIIQDARAFIKSLAEKHSRNADWAQKAVTQSLSITSGEAVEKDVVDYEVKNFDQLKEILDGKKVKKDGEEFILDFDQPIETIDMPFFKKFLNYLSHPNFAYILLILGIYGLIYEFTNPGIGFGAVLGGLSLLLAALALQIIPVNIVGILLMIFGIILMVMDIWVPSFGILTAGGLVSFLFGSLTIFDVREFPLEVSLSLVIGATVVTGLFFVFAAGSGIRIQKKKVSTGSEGMVGLEGVVNKTLSPGGEVFVRGEIWKAESKEGKIKKGEEVKVVEIKGNLITVEKKEEEK